MRLKKSLKVFPSRINFWENILEAAIILPTYNESENIRDLILAIERLNINPLILVIDELKPRWHTRDSQKPPKRLQEHNFDC